MELSFAPGQELPHAAAAAWAEAVHERARPVLFDVPVPPRLRSFGSRVQASALGEPANPPVVVLGGISGDCFPSVRPDGSLGWWNGLVGEGRAIDPRHHYVIGLCFAADETGASAPTTPEQAEVLAVALDVIGIDRPAFLVGASYGAMVNLAFAEAQPQLVDRLVVISGSAEPHPQSTAARELQRRVVALGIESGRGDEALAIARGMAMLTYRSPAEFGERFSGGIDGPAALCCSDPGRYLRARGEAFASVMSPQRFLSLSASIDRHRIEPRRIRAPSLVIGARSDQLVFEGEVRRLAEELSGPTELHLLDSLYGHDMFLKEAARIGEIIAPFLANGR
jgi:homoserine O-acetyltransferase